MRTSLKRGSSKRDCSKRGKKFARKLLELQVTWKLEKTRNMSPIPKIKMTINCFKCAKCNFFHAKNIAKQFVCYEEFLLKYF